MGDCRKKPDVRRTSHSRLWRRNIRYGSREAVPRHSRKGLTSARHTHSEAAWRLFRDHLPAIAARRAPRRKQNLREGSYLWASFDWGAIDWGRDAKGVRGHIRCLCESSDAAHTFVAGAKVKVRDAEVVEQGEWSAAAASAQPGQVLGVNDRGVVVQTGKGQVVLTKYAISNDLKVSSLASVVARTSTVIMG